MAVSDVAASRHLPALDGVRGLAILLVMLHHQTVMVPQTDGQFALYHLIMGGWIGVDVFFVLSGFLITGILLDSRSSALFYRSFYARRALRIFPLFYAIAIFSFVVLPYLPLPQTKAARFDTVGDDQWMYWMFLSNFAIVKVDAFRHGIMDVTWSVAIEEQFYLVWPTIVLLLDRRRLMMLCAAIVVASPVARWFALESGMGYAAAYVFTPLRLDGLAAGALVAMMVRDPVLRTRLTAPRALTVGVAGVAIFVAVAVASGSANIDGAYVQPLGITGATLFALGCLVGAITAGSGSAWVRALSSAPMRMLGTYSYCLYLIHLPIRAALRDVVLQPVTFAKFPGGVLVGQAAFYALAFAVTVPVAMLSYHLFEKQFLKLKRFAPYDGEGRPGAR